MVLRGEKKYSLYPWVSRWREEVLLVSLGFKREERSTPCISGCKGGKNEYSLYPMILMGRKEVLLVSHGFKGEE